MKFRSERDSLADVLATAGRAVVGRGSPSAVLSGLSLRAQGNHLEVTGTDLDLTIRVLHEIIGIADGTCILPARLTADVVRSLEPGAVTVEAGEDRVEISSARARFALRTFPVPEWPALPPPEPAKASLPRAAFTEALRQVVRAASNDETRPLLTGVLLTSEGDAVRLVATDSYRLALRDLEGFGVGGGAEALVGSEVLVPARALAEVQRLSGSAWGDAARAATSAPGGGAGDVEPGDPGTTTSGDGHGGANGHGSGTGRTSDEIGVVAGSTEITFVCGPVRISTRLLEGTYPDYRQLLPTHYPNRLHVGRESLLAALRRVRLLVRDNTTPVRLCMRASGVDLTVVSQEVGDASESVDGDFSGEDLVMAFNPNYLIDGVEAVLDDEVFIESDTPAKPATVRAAGRDDFRYLLMPVRVP